MFRVSKHQNGGRRKRRQLICRCRGETGRGQVVVYQYIGRSLCGSESIDIETLVLDKLSIQ